jgi:peptidoglycan/xylan/chitin deacetylase (PgdA/CDA1 family)
MKSLAFTIFHALGLIRFAAWWNRRRVMILCYHGVTERQERSPLDPFGLHIRHERFTAQLDYLQQHYHVISLRDYLKAKDERRALPDYSVVLTFDDGYRNFLTAAAPRLAERKMPASVFVITERVRSDNPKLESAWAESDDVAYLSWEEAQELSKEQAIEFGSHTCSHRKLSQLSLEDAERELHASQAVITERIGNGALPLAYPYGSYSEAIIEKARALNYACALTTDAGTNDPQTDPFALRRTLIGDDDDKVSFAARVSGLTFWLSRAFSPLRSKRLMTLGSLRVKRSDAYIE